MAELIPSVLPSHATKGERKTAEAMKALPDGCLVYYEPTIKDRKADIIVITPSLGVIIMEVKDWNIGQIVHADNNGIGLQKKDRIEAVRNPYEQAREYMNSLRNFAKWSAGSEILLHKEGQHQGQFIFPFNHLCVFPNISNQEIDDNGLRPIFPKDRTIASDSLKALMELSGEALKQALRRHLTYVFPFTHLNEHQMDVFRGIVHPRIVVRRTEDEFTVLTREQEDFARKDLQGHRILLGVTGSGKTVVLLARAKFLAEDGSKAVLVLCYNRLLCGYLQSQLASFSNIAVDTFDAWAAQNGVHREDDESDSQFGSRLLERFENGAATHCARFDAVLIDETQDFCREWLTSARLSLKDPDNGDFFLAGDGTQKTARSPPFAWSDVGIHARGRTKYLNINYRNTKNLLKAAAQLVKKRPASRHPETDENSFPRCEIDWKRAIRTGADPVISVFKDRAEECQYAAFLAETWIRTGLQMQGRLLRLSPRDIAILYPARPQRDEAIATAFEALKTSLQAFAPVAILRGKDMQGALQDDSIKLTTLQSVKGLEFPAVIIIWTDLAGEKWFEVRNDSPGPPVHRDDAGAGATGRAAFQAISAPG